MGAITLDLFSRALSLERYLGLDTLWGLITFILWWHIHIAIRKELLNSQHSSLRWNNQIVWSNKRVNVDDLFVLVSKLKSWIIIAELIWPNGFIKRLNITKSVLRFLCTEKFTPKSKFFFSLIKQFISESPHEKWSERRKRPTRAIFLKKTSSLNFPILKNGFSLWLVMFFSN